MDHVPSIKKRRGDKWRIIGLIIIIFLFIGCMIGFVIKSKAIQVAVNKLGRQRIALIFIRDREKAGEEMRMGATGEPISTIELENQYKEFEKLFREQQDDIKGLVEELLSQELLEKKDFQIVFDEEWYLSMQWSNPSGNELLYSNGIFKAEENEELIKILNENTVLKEVLNSIIEKGVIINICVSMSGDIWTLDFLVDTKFTPFITGNNGVTNAFVYCESGEYEKYGYKKIEDNWYLWISPAPE